MNRGRALKHDFNQLGASRFRRLEDLAGERRNCLLLCAIFGTIEPAVIDYGFIAMIAELVEFGSSCSLSQNKTSPRASDSGFLLRI